MAHRQGTHLCNICASPPPTFGCQGPDCTNTQGILALSCSCTSIGLTTTPNCLDWVCVIKHIWLIQLAGNPNAVPQQPVQPPAAPPVFQLPLPPALSSLLAPAPAPAPAPAVVQRIVLPPPLYARSVGPALLANPAAGVLGVYVLPAVLLQLAGPLLTGHPRSWDFPPLPENGPALGQFIGNGGPPKYNTASQFPDRKLLGPNLIPFNTPIYYMHTYGLILVREVIRCTNLNPGNQKVMHIERRGLNVPGGWYAFGTFKTFSEIARALCSLHGLRVQMTRGDKIAIGEAPCKTFHVYNTANPPVHLGSLHHYRQDYCNRMGTARS